MVTPVSGYWFNVGERSIDLSSPVVMAILNVTPDSFYGASRMYGRDEIVSRVRQAIEEGADIIDVGGYSSRPGADNVPPEEELRRVLLAVGIIREEAPEMIVSLDTFRSPVAYEVIRQFGECIINDISAGELDPEIMDVAAGYEVPYIAMHMRGMPSDMQEYTVYDDIAAEVTDYFRRRTAVLEKAGVRNIIIDPGFGFAKTTEQNYALLSRMGELDALGYPVLAGISRKSMIYKVLDTTPYEALAGTTALHWECLRQGAKILRVHDVKAAADTVKVFKYYKKHEIRR